MNGLRATQAGDFKLIQDPRKPKPQQRKDGATQASSLAFFAFFAFRRGIQRHIDSKRLTASFLGNQNKLLIWHDLAN